MDDKRSHVTSDIRYHFVWHTKDKTAILDDGIRGRLKEVLAQDCKVKKIVI